MHIFDCSCGNGRTVFDGAVYKCTSCNATFPVTVTDMPEKNMKRISAEPGTPLRLGIVPGDRLTFTKTAADGSKISFDWDFTVTTPEEAKVTCVYLDLYYKATFDKLN
jgi:hypothetical protein